MKRSGERCNCGRIIPYLTCSHCEAQQGTCPSCGEVFLMVYGDAATAGAAVLDKARLRMR